MLFRLYAHWRDSYVGIPRVIWFIALINLVNRCGSMVIAFITLYLTQKLGFPIREAGYVMVFFGAGALVGAFLGGRLTDRIGYAPVQFWSLVLNGLMLLFLLLVRDFWPMCAAIFTLSLVAELFRPANSVAMARHSEAATRTRSISLYRMSANLGWTVAPLFGGLLVAIGWEWLFWVDGLTCIAAAILVRRLLPSKAIANEEQPAESQAISTEKNSPYRDRTYLWFVFLTMLNAVVFMQILWTVPVFFKEVYHWHESKIGLITALNGLIVFLVEMPLVHRLEGRRPQLAYVQVGLVLYALAYLAFVAPLGALAAALLFTVAISIGEIFVMPFSSNYVFGRSAGSQQGQYMGLYTIAYSVSNIIAPLFGTQVIAAWGYASLWWMLVVLALIVWVGFGWMERQRVANGQAFS
jgi:predicted MFS family arabinose efflux permease